MKVHIIEWGRTGSIKSIHDDYMDACAIAEKMNKKIPKWQIWIDKLFYGEETKWRVKTFEVKSKQGEGLI